MKRCFVNKTLWLTLLLLTQLLLTLSCGKDSSTSPEPSSFSISGIVIDSSENGISGVNVSVSGKTALTNSTGHYTIQDLLNGTYTISCAKDGFTIYPSSKQFTISGSNLELAPVIATPISSTCSISGYILGPDDNGVSGVLIQLSGNGVSVTANTDSTGAYSFSGITNGTYTITPAKEGYSFSSSSQQVVVDGSDATVLTIRATPILVTISGRIVNKEGGGVYGVEVHISGGGMEQTVTTNQSGYYSFEGVLGTTYLLSFLKEDYYFFPSKNVSFIVSGSDVTVANVTAKLLDYLSFVTIPAGTFQMGDIQNFTSYTWDKPVHSVTLTSFEMSVYEITQGQYQAVTMTNPSYFDAGDNYPVEQVSWEDAVKFCNALSEAAGFEKCYNERTWACDFSKNGFRLPTDAEWEYACRAGTETFFYTGNDLSSDHDVNTSKDLDRAAWYNGNSGGETHPVGEKEQNSFGLFDMHGNIYEWCNDWFGEYYYSSSPSSNPTGPSTGSFRVRRGGCIFNNARYCRSAIRAADYPTYTNYAAGFRIVCRP